MSLHQLVVGLFRALAFSAIRHPKSTVLIAAAVTLAVAPGILRLTLRTDGHALVSASAPEVVFDQSIRETFGLDDEIVVLIRSEDTHGIYNPHTVQVVRDLTAAFGALPSRRATNVVSLATEASFRFRPGTLMPQRLLEPPLKTPAELDRLRDDLDKIQVYTGTLVSADGKSTAILIGAPPAGDRTRFYEAILRIIAAQGPLPEDIAVTGAPVAEALLGLHILEDLGVPKALLGTTTRTRAEQRDWKVPSSFFEWRRLIARQLGLLPVAVVVMLLVFFASFRNVTATLLPLPEVAAVLLFTFGLMGWAGVPIYLTIAVMPVLLVAMCVTDEIHVFSRYFALLRERPGVPHVELVRETMDEMCCPVANTTLTTAIGFVSFAFSPLGPVQAFGIFTALGVLFSLGWSLTVIPAMLVLVPPKWLGAGRRASAGMASPWFGRFALAVVRHRVWVAGLVLLIAALTPLGLRRLVVQDSWIDGFDPDSEFRRATRLVNEQFHGMHLLYVCLDARRTFTVEVPATHISPNLFRLPTNLVEHPRELSGARFTLTLGEPVETKRAASPPPPPPAASNATPSSTTNRLAELLPWRSRFEMITVQGSQILGRTPIQDAPAGFWSELAQTPRVRLEIAAQSHLKPGIIRLTSDLAGFIRQRRQFSVGGVLSPADYLATTRFMIRPTDPQARVLPNDAGEIKMLWDYYRIARGPERLRQVVDDTYGRSLITVFLKDGNFIDTGRLLDDLHAFEREHLAPQGIRMGIAGDVAVSQSLVMGIVSTQLRSLGWSLVGIAVVTSLLGRSMRWGFYAVLPSTLAVLINFAVMGWFDIPLGVATSMFAGMTLGIGVDFAIHLLEGHGFALARGLSTSDALRAAMAQTARPVLINTIAISLGFGVLMLSQVPANARLGLLVVLGLVDCLIASLLLLPVLLHWWPLKNAREHGKAPTPPAPRAGH